MRKTLHIALADQGVSAWNRWRANNPTAKPDFDGIDLSEIPFSGAHLSGSDLSLVNFSGVNLSKAYLNETCLRGATLRNTNLSGAHLIEADFSGADLSGANLMNTYLMGTNFSAANLNEANLSAANLRGASFDQANLTHANFSKTDIREATFNKANLSGACLREVTLSKRNLSGNNLEHADLCGADLSAADLRGANLNGANLRGTNLWEANLSRAKLIAADLREADLSRANLSEADLSRANLMGANLKEVDFRGANLSGVNFRGEDLWDNHLLNQNIDPVLHSTCDYCRMSAWNVKINAATMQSNLVIAQAGEPTLNIDSFEIAQFIDLLLNNTRLRLLLDTITSKVVLILGHFTSERKAILNAIQEGLRKHDYLPVLFDFEHSGSHNFTEMVSTLARLARFVLADFTDASAVLEQVPHIVRNLAVPVQPLLSVSSGGEPAILSTLQNNHHVILQTYRYVNSRDILESFETQVIFPAETKVRELGKI